MPSWPVKLFYTHRHVCYGFRGSVCPGTRSVPTVQYCKPFLGEINSSPILARIKPLSRGVSSGNTELPSTHSHSVLIRTMCSAPIPCPLDALIQLFIERARHFSDGQSLISIRKTCRRHLHNNIGVIPAHKDPSLAPPPAHHCPPLNVKPPIHKST